MHKGDDTNTVKGGGGEGRARIFRRNEFRRWIPEEGGEGVRPEQRTRSGRETQHKTSRERAHWAGAQIRWTDKGGNKTPWSSEDNKARAHSAPAKQRGERHSVSTDTSETQGQTVAQRPSS
jgi:hypothetical protein